MKKRSLCILLIVLIVCLLVPTDVFAHPGRLDGKGCHKCNADNTDCARWGLNDYEYHCHNGDTYSNSKGQVFNKYGVKISDPVVPEPTPQPKPEPTPTPEPQPQPPVSNDKPTNSNSNNSSSANSNSKPSTNTNWGDSYNNTNKHSTNTDVGKENKIEKLDENEKKISSDATIKTLKVNGRNVDIVDNMFVETIKKSLNLKITTNSDKAKADYVQQEFIMGENEIKIKIIAEDGTEKEYKLIVKRVEGPGTATIKELSLGSYNIEFDNYKAKIYVTKGEVIEDISYSLSDNNAILKLYVNDKEVKRITELKGNDILTLVTIDEDNNKLTYEVRINEMSLTESVISGIITYGVIAVIFGGPIVGGVFAFKFIKKKNKK